MEKRTVFPENVAQVHQLFSNGELWFTMSNNDAEVDSKIAEGLFLILQWRTRVWNNSKFTHYKNIV
jgi:hypothetical protein